jgi:hypothetical protein
MQNEQIKENSFGNWPLPENVLVEIGRMHSLFSCMEKTLIISISKLAGFNNIYDMRPMILLNHTSFQQKIDILSSLFEYLKEEFPNLSKYNEVISKLSEAQTQRNKYTHQSIVFDADTESLKLTTCSVRRKLKTDVKKICVEDIKRVILDIDDANKALYELVFKRP